MTKYLLKMAGSAAVLLALHLTGLAQATGDVLDDDTTSPSMRNNDEIVIRHKSDKDTKVTIEIKNGEVFVNGKPASEYEDDNLVITRRKVRPFKNGTIIMDGGDMAISPFRGKGGGTWNFDGDNLATERAFLGVTSMRPEDGTTGAKIGQVSPGSAAEKAGLKEGDLITKVDELPIERPEDLSRAIGKYKPEEKVTITFIRDGKEQKVTATLGRNKNMNVYGFGGPNGEDFFRQFTIPPNAYNFSYGNSSRLGIRAQDTEDGKGVKVLDVDEESAAAKAGIKSGDIITQFDGKDVNNAPALANAARESHIKPSVHVKLLRDGKPLELDIKTPRKLRTADL